MAETEITIAVVRAAAARIAPHAHRTPVLTSSQLDALVGARLFFKCENLQKVGAFKFRGACNAVYSLSDEEARSGVVTHSSGNHAQALSLAARLRGIEAHVVMPRTSLPGKVAAVRAYGGQIALCEPNQRAREETAEQVIARTGAQMIHPYDDPRIIAGQGTAALELIEEQPDLELALTPVGGGGLTSGTLIAFSALSPQTRVIGVEPEGADDAQRSLQAGRILPSIAPRTICDGLLTSLSENTFAVIRAGIHAITTASDPGVIRAMRLVWERMKLVIEPSAAVPLAALLEGRVDPLVQGGIRGKRIGIILSGGIANLDAPPPWLAWGQGE
jgi:threonine dehydratase